MDSELIERTRTRLWQQIRRSQRDGFSVRNRLMARRFTLPPGEWYARHSDDGRSVCLLGSFIEADRQPDVAARDALEIEYYKVLALEAGFEGWNSHANELPEFFNLGREIALALEEEEAKALARTSA